MPPFPNPAGTALVPVAALAALIPAALALALVVVLRPAWVVRALLAPLLSEVIFCGDGRRRELALTIDDGPSPGSGDLLALLRELELPATLFAISGHLAQGPPGFLAQALADGHGIGHHMDRDSLTACLGPARFRQAFDQAADQLQRAAAPQQLALRWFRPGGGWFRASMLASLQQRGYRLVLGSVFPWDTFHPPLAWMRWFVLHNAHPGAILVLHDRPDTLPATLELLRQVVPALRQRGYRFVRLERLLNS
jgi:peptidoglycan/xylan/chitin deacetylase (PgdA/CDA1 family)